METKDKKLVLANVLMWFITALYTISPIDFVPDFIPVLGWLDDLVAIGITIAFTFNTIATLKDQVVGIMTTPAPKRTVLDAFAEEADAVADGYEPLSIEQIRGL